MASNNRRPLRRSASASLLLAAVTVASIFPSASASPRTFAMVLQRQNRHSTRTRPDRTPNSYDEYMQKRHTETPFSPSSRYFTEHGEFPRLAHAETAPPVPVTYTNNPKSILNWCNKHLKYSGCIIGLDVESAIDLPWADSPHFKGPATVQLATADAALVVHLVRRGRSVRKPWIPSWRRSQACVPILQSIICDPQFIKVGCALDDDILDLERAWNPDKKSRPMDARSRLDLGGLILNQDDESLGSKRGLKSLMHDMLGIDLPKHKSIATSDWSQAPLQPAQIEYAARDAWAGAVLAEELAARNPEEFGHEQLVETLERTERPFDMVVARSEERAWAKRERENTSDRSLRKRLLEIIRCGPADFPTALDVRGMFPRPRVQQRNSTSVM